MKTDKLNSAQAAEPAEPEAIAPAKSALPRGRGANALLRSKLEDVFTDLNALPRYVAAVEKGHISKRAAEEYHAALRDLLAIVKPEPDDNKFWLWVDGISRYIEEHLRHDVKAAVTHAVWSILHDGGWSIKAWLQAAALVNAYKALCTRLSDTCWRMPGIDKGDDGYNDWIDALPLAGKRVVTDILAHDLAVYTAVYTAIEHDHPKLRRMICNAENYVRMTMCEELERLFTSVGADEEDE